MAVAGATEDSVPCFLPVAPREVLTGILWYLQIPSIADASQCCKSLLHEARENELWFHLFFRACWPPSNALLAFAEGTKDPLSVDWRCRFQKRAEAAPTIVVDIGRGYTKYTIVHGVKGRLEGDGVIPPMLQLCSSPTHPPDCVHHQQLLYVHYELNARIREAASNPDHQLHGLAVKGRGAKLEVGSSAIVKGVPGKGGMVVRLRSYQEQDDTWEGIEEKTGAMVVAGSGDLAAIAQAEDLDIIVGEPFVISMYRAHGRGSNYNLSACWDETVQRQLGASRKGSVQIASQAQMALWAHGVEHGIVVNIGQGHTVAIPVVDRTVAGSLAECSEIGSGLLTQMMLQRLRNKYRFIDSHLMTWCRNLKEKYCYVMPPCAKTGHISLRERLARGEDLFGVMSVDVELPPEFAIQGEGDRPPAIRLAEERVLVPEELFVSEPGRPSLPSLIVHCAERALSSGICDESNVKSLLQQIVLVGGAADFAGIRHRTEFEVRRLVKEIGSRRLLDALGNATEDVYVLNPPLSGGDGGNLLASPRFIPLLGGSVRAACSFGSGGCGRSISSELPLHSLGNTTVPFMRMEFLRLDGSAVFRAGGGGGQDDDEVLRMLEFDQGLDDDDDESELDLPAQEYESASEQRNLESPANESSSSSSSEMPVPPPATVSKGGTKGRRGGKGKGKGSGKGKKGKNRQWKGNGKSFGTDTRNNNQWPQFEPL